MANDERLQKWASYNKWNKIQTETETKTIIPSFGSEQIDKSNCKLVDYLFSDDEEDGEMVVKTTDNKLMPEKETSNIDCEITPDLPNESHELVKDSATEVSEISDSGVDYIIDPFTIVDRKNIENVTSYRVETNDWTSDGENDSSSDSNTSSSDDSSSSASSLSSEEDEDITDNIKKETTYEKHREVFVEEGFKNLPPIEQLSISVEVNEITMLGTVSSFVEQLVIIQATKEHPALNLDSVLFLENGKALGKIFDVFGQVAQPFYSVRFNTTEEISTKNVIIGDKVYCAPDRPEFTQYVFLEQLRRMRATDASWENDKETPLELCDFSDDEEEKQCKRQKNGRRTAAQNSANAPNNKFSRQNMADQRSCVMSNSRSTSVRGTPFRNQSHTPAPAMNPFSQLFFNPPPPPPLPPSALNGTVNPSQYGHDPNTFFNGGTVTQPLSNHMFNSVVPPVFMQPPPMARFSAPNPNSSNIPVSSNAHISIYRFPPPGFFPRSS